MALYSWFSNTLPRKKTAAVETLKVHNDHNVWPIAQVRNNTVVQQQQYVNAKALHKSKPKKFTNLYKKVHN